MENMSKSDATSANVFPEYSRAQVVALARRSPTSYHDHRSQLVSTASSSLRSSNPFLPAAIDALKCERGQSTNSLASHVLPRG